MFLTVTKSLLDGLGAATELFVLTLLFSLPLGLIIAFGSMSKWQPLRNLPGLRVFWKWKLFQNLNTEKKFVRFLMTLRPVSAVTNVFVWIIRGTPLMLQLGLQHFLRQSNMQRENFLFMRSYDIIQR